MYKGFIIAIDGPVASGKGTIAPLLASQLDGFYLYTGAMYRCLALYCISNGIDLSRGEKIEKILSEVNIDLFNGKVVLNKEDVTRRIKDEDVARGSSKVAVVAKAREYMVNRQREIAESYIRNNKIVVAEGRDVATKIFPNAKVKVFLTASLRIRAERRLEQLREQGDKKTTIEELLDEVQQRDKRDSEREIDPLVKEPEKYGYFVVDNSNLTIDETLSKISSFLKEKGLIYE